MFIQQVFRIKCVHINGSQLYIILTYSSALNREGKILISYFYVVMVTLLLCSQAQTRSADEPMTTFALCLECGNRWKVGE